MSGRLLKAFSVQSRHPPLLLRDLCVSSVLSALNLSLHSFSSFLLFKLSTVISKLCASSAFNPFCSRHSPPATSFSRSETQARRCCRQLLSGGLPPRAPRCRDFSRLRHLHQARQLACPYPRQRESADQFQS